MTFAEACELAAVINGTSRVAVMAIGRFLTPPEIQEAAARGTLGTIPWCVSVMAIEDEKQRAVLRSEEQWRDFVECLPVELKQARKAPEPVAPPARKQSQMTLFE